MTGDQSGRGSSSRCRAPEPANSPHGGNGWTCKRRRWHLGKHRLGNYAWPLPCDCGCPPGDHADYRPTLRTRLRSLLGSRLRRG